MMKRLFAIALTLSLLNIVWATPVTAQSSPSKEEKRVAKFKQVIVRAGTGPEARVEVKLVDQTQVSGFVSEAAADYFVITDAKTQATRNVKYTQVGNLKLIRPGRHSSGPTSAAGVFKKIVIGTALVLTAVAIGCVVSKRCVE